MNIKSNKAVATKLLNDKPQRGRPVLPKREVTKSSQIATRPNETRATFIMDEGLLSKLKSIAYWERVTIKEVANNAFREAVAKYEKRNGEIKLKV